MSGGRNTMSMISGDCFSCWSSEPWWDCYVRSLKANKMLLTTWQLRVLLVRINLLILFSLFFHLQFVFKHLLLFLPSVLFTAWNESLIFRVVTAIPVQTAICDSQELSLIGHICQPVSFLLSQCFSCDCIYDATVHAYKFKMELLWIFCGSQLESPVSLQVSALLLVLLNTKVKVRPPHLAFDTGCSLLLASTEMPQCCLVTEYKPWSEKQHITHCLALTCIFQLIFNSLDL